MTDGVLYSKADMRLVWVPRLRKGVFKIPQGVRAIADKAFSRCPALREIIIPDSVTTIGFAAFADCARMKRVTIPDSVTSIGNNAFGNCPRLTLIVSRGSCAERHCIQEGLNYVV